jgi:hypothetical protein
LQKPALLSPVRKTLLMRAALEGLDRRTRAWVFFFIVRGLPTHQLGSALNTTLTKTLKPLSDEQVEA